MGFFFYLQPKSFSGYLHNHHFNRERRGFIFQGAAQPPPASGLPALPHPRSPHPALYTLCTLALHARMSAPSSLTWLLRSHLWTQPRQSPFLQIDMRPLGVSSNQPLPFRHSPHCPGTPLSNGASHLCAHAKHHACLHPAVKTAACNDCDCPLKPSYNHT